jgi:hypothetical protein
MPWGEYAPGTEAYIGGGMTLSITKMLIGMIPPGCIQVGFSVTTDAVGLEFTGVDYEAGPVFPPGGASTAGGDIFYSVVTGIGANPNYLWYEEAALGLDPGSWVNGVSADLADLADNLDGLDSDSAVVVTAVPWKQEYPGHGGIEWASAAPNPMRGEALLRFSTARAGRVQLTVHDLLGRVVVRLLNEFVPAGEHAVAWSARDADGRRVPTGLYFVRAALEGEARTLKVVVQN